MGKDFRKIKEDSYFGKALKKREEETAKALTNLLEQLPEHLKNLLEVFEIDLLVDRRALAKKLKTTESTLITVINGAKRFDLKKLSLIKKLSKLLNVPLPPELLGFENANQAEEIEQA